MNPYRIPFAKLELIVHMIQTGGGFICPIERAAADRRELSVTIEQEQGGKHFTASFPYRGQLHIIRIPVTGSAHLALAEWIEDAVNGRLDDDEADPLNLAPHADAFNRAELEALLPQQADHSAEVSKVVGAAVAEQEPVAWAIFDGGWIKDHTCARHRAEQWAEYGLEVTPLFTAPRGAAQPSSAPDMVNHPPHYTGHPSGVECIEVTEHLPFCLGNAFKYLFRRDAKGSTLENIEKAIWYVERYVTHDVDYEWTLPSDVRYQLGEIVTHEPHPFGAAMLLIAGPGQCGGYDACICMLQEEAERLRRGAEPRRAA